MISQELKSKLKKGLPASFQRRLFNWGIIQEFKPPVGSVRWGDFNRPNPISTEFGYDRGGPVDRYYIEKFLLSNKDFVHGNVLEIGNNDYTVRFGGDRVMKSDVLHVEEGNPAATYVGDLSGYSTLPDNYFDCIILTQTLHLIFDYTSAILTCKRILKKGGVLLLTVPGITPSDAGQWKDYWLWAFTSNAIKKILYNTFEEGSYSVTSYGNVQAATGFLYGIGVQEIRESRLDYFDPSFEVIIAAKVIK